jgi:hypothetical protein
LLQRPRHQAQTHPSGQRQVLPSELRQKKEKT